MSTSPSNVLFVVMDTVRKDRLTPYGCERDTTPGLAAFAEEATVFEQAVAPAPWTLPVHASMFTGLYPSQHGADQESPYLEGVRTLAGTLSAAGYRTACYSSNAWITPYTRLTAGFDEQDNFFEVMPGDLLSGPLARAWQALNDHESLRAIADRLVSLGNAAHERLAGGPGTATRTPAVIDRTAEFVARGSPGRVPDDGVGGASGDGDGIGDRSADGYGDGDEGDRWFAFLNLMDAHLPYRPPPEYRREFAPDADPEAVCQNSKEYNCGARSIDDAEWRQIRDLYDAEIAHADAQLTRLFDWLKERGQWEDTAVVVCADHGELHGEHGLYGHEFALYDQLVNVPLLIKHPALDADRCERQVELLDLYHTVLDATGVTDVDPGSADERAVAFDPTRSLLSPEYREWDVDGDGEDSAVDDGDGASDLDLDPDSDSDSDSDDPDDPGKRGGGEYAFVEYSRPVVELQQLEEKAAAAGIDLDEDSRFYARMRAARHPDAKYVRIDRTPDEAYRLDRDPDETENLAGAGSGDGIADDRIARTERALAAFEAAVGGAWTRAQARDGRARGGDGALRDMDDETKRRLRDLGYVE